LTKHSSDENGLKCHLTMEEPKKVVEDNLLVVCNVQDSPELESKLENAAIRTAVKPKKSGLGKIISELYDLEDCVESEKPVKIDLDLDLYQMEKV
jgi:hypothetical protein